MTKNGLLDELNPQQQQAVIYTHGPQLILAGAGSGKTRVLTYKVAYLIDQQNTPPDAILMVTFTNKAAAEMKNRISTLLHNNQALPFAGTFHSFCARVLRREGRILGLAPDFTIYDEIDQKDAIVTLMKQLAISPQEIHPGSIRTTISQAKNELLSAQEYAAIARGRFQEKAARIYIEYEKLLRQSQAVDFDDLLLLTVRLLTITPHITTRYQKQYKHLLVDEYQDTNTAQFELTRILSHLSEQITVVGDASQSIYAWRGANFQNITRFRTQFPQTKTFHLTQNYRSTKSILEGANSVIKKNTGHDVLNLWTDNPKGEKITLFEARNEQTEALFIISEIEKHNLPWSSVAVLYRTNAQSRVIEEALLHAGIPYHLVGGVRFYERKEIKDVLAYLRLVANPDDTMAKKRIEKIGKNRARRFWEWQEKKPTGTTEELLEKLLKTVPYLELYDKNNPEDTVRLENVKELKSVASVFPHLTDFLENVALVEAEYLPTSPLEQVNTITLMTMHAAKGLEFPTVFIVGMEEGLFPHSRAFLNNEELEEERRLCYVAMTRAKTRLYLTHARRRLYFGQYTSNIPSRFLADIPESVTQETHWDSY